MFSYIKSFLSRHKKKIFFLGILVGGGVLGSRYAQRRFIQWQEKETKEFLEKRKKQHYFESSERTCNQTIICLSSTLRENIVKLVNCEEIILKLRSNPPNKVELWQQLKVLVFTKVCLLIYSSVLLVIALRIQLNIIGGYIYCKTQVTGGDSKASNDLQEKYLSQCHYFLNEGFKHLLPLVQEKVLFTLKDVPLTQNLSLQNLENIFWAVQSSINSDVGNPIKCMPQLLYGSDFEKEDPLIKDMMIDTIELLQNSEVVDLAHSCLSRGFSSLIDKISEFFLPEGTNSACVRPSTSREEDNIVKFAHPNKLSKPLAKVIPIINGFGNNVNSEFSEAWISPFIYMDRLKTLGANVYESFSCPKN